MNVTADMTKGIIDRFRTMSVSKAAVLAGHAGAGVVRNTISTITIIATALILGFRPQGKSSGLVSYHRTSYVGKHRNFTACSDVRAALKDSGGFERTYASTLHFALYQFRICSCQFIGRRH